MADAGRDAGGHPTVPSGASPHSAEFPELADHVQLLVLQPTPFCNIDCRYCYLPDRGRRDQMSVDIVRQVIRWLRSADLIGETLNLVWHAGEPLTVPVTFYEDAQRVVVEELPPGVELQSSVQTNGMLLSDEWCDFIKRSGLQIGISIDGPRFVNDRNRLSRSGKSTFEQSMAGIRLLQAHGIDFHIISVLTKESLEFPDELFTFYRDLGISHVGFNIDELESDNPASSMQAHGAEALFRRFLTRFLWLMDTQGNGAFDLREFDQLSQFIMAPPATSVANTQTTPFAMLNVDWQGNISSFSPELLGASGPDFEHFTFGNVCEDSFEAVSGHPNFRRIASEIAEGVEMCLQSCEYFDLCGGGAPSNKIFENGRFASTETVYCRLMIQSLADIVLTDLESRIERAGAN